MTSAQLPGSGHGTAALTPRVLAAKIAGASPCHALGDFAVWLVRFRRALRRGAPGRHRRTLGHRVAPTQDHGILIPPDRAQPGGEHPGIDVRRQDQRSGTCSPAALSAIAALAFSPDGEPLFCTDNGPDSSVRRNDDAPDELNHVSALAFASWTPFPTQGRDTAPAPRGSELRHDYGHPRFWGAPPPDSGTRGPVAELPAHGAAAGLTFFTGPQAGEFDGNVLMAMWGPAGGRSSFAHNILRARLRRQGDSYTAQVTPIREFTDAAHRRCRRSVWRPLHRRPRRPPHLPAAAPRPGAVGSHRAIIVRYTQRKLRADQLLP